MIEIKPVSDLRNNFASIEKIVESGMPVYLTKNGYGKMVVMSIEQYSELMDQTEKLLDEADAQASSSPVRLSHEEVFETLRERIRGQES